MRKAVLPLFAGGTLALCVLASAIVWSASERNSGSQHIDLADSTTARDPALKLSPASTPGALMLTREASESVRRATVFVHATIGGEDYSGSGFIVKSLGDEIYIVTSRHVVSDEESGQSSVGPEVKVDIMFHPGMPGERLIANVEIVTVDEESDLAVLRVIASAQLPTPLEPADERSLAEGMSAYLFGFPGGVQKITVNKVSVSQLRWDDHNTICDIQLNGDLKPGDSGGPVVDGNGRVIGVAVSTLIGKNVGWAAPVSKLKRLLP